MPGQRPMEANKQLAQLMIERRGQPGREEGALDFPLPFHMAWMSSILLGFSLSVHTVV